MSIRHEWARFTLDCLLRKKIDPKNEKKKKSEKAKEHLKINSWKYI